MKKPKVEHNEPNLYTIGKDGTFEQGMLFINNSSEACLLIESSSKDLITIYNSWDDSSTSHRLIHFKGNHKFKLCITDEQKEYCRKIIREIKGRKA
jgi:hypothetical protein